tara:strand:- start:469 stop:606 length:138 start_codon:yes stop_codon:yes gene_type:complete
VAIAQVLLEKKIDFLVGGKSFQDEGGGVIGPVNLAAKPSGRQVLV